MKGVGHQLYQDFGIPLPKPRYLAKRLLEEAAELVLACGGTPGDVLLAAADAIASECQKRDDRYPSEVEPLDVRKGEILGEVADVQMLLDLIRDVANLNPDDVEWALGTKEQTLRKAWDRGQIYVTKNRIFYRRKQR